MSKRYQAPSVKKAFQILKNISDANRGLGVSELSKDLGISKSTVHGITSALEELGVIIKDPLTKRYKLGFTLFELGRLAYSNVDIRAVARPVMDDLMKTTDSSVFLGVFSLDHVTILDIVESGHDLKITSPVGTKIPILAGATGKVFMACLSEEQAMKIVLSKGLTKYTDNTIINPGHYFQEIRDVRRKGYATDDEEYILGVRAVAAPIHGNTSLMSAIWVVGLKPSLDGDKMKAVIEETLQAAATISRRIQERAVVQE